MSEIKSVAIAGASGSLGPHVLRALVDANFQVTVLTRSNKPGTYDANVKVVEVDFTSLESLTAALQGIDAIVSTVAGAAIEGQTVLIDAAVAAGVRRFIPSEFGSVTTNPQLKTFPVYSSMFKTREYLEEQAKAGKVTWTVLACGSFLDYFLDHSLLLDFKKYEATWYDDGDNRFSSTSQENIGKAIARIFKNLEATENKIVRVSEIILTQNRFLRIAEELQPDIKWNITKVRTSDLLKEGLDQFKSGDHSMPVFMKILVGTALAGDTYGAAYDKTDNELLGVKELTEEDLKALVASQLT